MDKKRMIYAIPYASIAIGFATTLIGFLAMNGVIPFSVVSEVEAMLSFIAGPFAVFSGVRALRNYKDKFKGFGG